jgi:hypothetical protein
MQKVSSSSSPQVNELYNTGQCHKGDLISANARIGEASPFSQDFSKESTWISRNHVQYVAVEIKLLIKARCIIHQDGKEWKCSFQA